jgi:hypothetical protein
MKKYKKKILKLIWPIVFRIRKLIHPINIFRYELRLKKKYNKFQETSYLSGLIYKIDENFQHGGLVDQIKGVVSAFYLSKIANIDFYIFFSDPHNPLLSIINTSEINIIKNKNNLSFSRKISTPVLWYNYFPKSKKNILSCLKNKKQIHLYCNVNVLPVFKNNSNEMITDWSKNFNQIFKLDLINSFNNNFIKNNHIGVHLRFMDLFGDFKDLNISQYSNEYRMSCLNWCVNRIIDLLFKYQNFKFLLVSDSKFFLDYCNKFPIINLNRDRIIINSNQIGHIYINKDIDVFRKAVSDFASLSLCSKIFQIRYGRMHNSDFSRYASFVNISDFKLIECAEFKW